ncbi:MAG: multiprotein bridging factor aMBF1 [Thermoproteota archaeon]
MICEICGSEASRLRKAVVEGSIVSVCPNCFNTLSKKIPIESGIGKAVRASAEKKEVAKQVMIKKVEKETPRENFETESMELIENYGTLIKKRRRALGWSEEDLGNKTGLKESLIKKIESGKITPSILDTRKIENALKIKLLILGDPKKAVFSTKHLIKTSYSNITLGDFLQNEAAEESNS